jgi:hypothetical protein
MLKRAFRGFARFVDRILSAHLPLSVWLDASTMYAYRNIRY